MGGNAFPDLYAPRIRPSTYFALKARIQTLLQQHFQYVHTPIEAPGKDDYGDLDFIVCEPLVTPEPPTNEPSSKKHTPKFRTEVVAAMIGAVHSQRVGSFDSWSFAIPWPEMEAPPFGAIEAEPPEDRQARFVQVDVDVQPSLEELKWMVWMHAHGDLNMIITLMVRRTGLRISNRGFFASIPEIEKDSPKLAEVFMTKDPALVMQFLGLGEERFWQPFASWDELMDYAATCRFHNPGFGRKRSEDNSGVNTPAEAQEVVKNGSKGDEKGCNEQSAASEPLKEAVACASLRITNSENGCTTVPAAVEKVKVDLDLKTTDKKRRVLRPMYRYWIDEYIPAHVDDHPRPSASMTKEDVLEQAKDFFGAEFASRYDEQRVTNMKRSLEPKLWRAMREYLNEQEIDSAVVTAAFKGWKRELTGDVEEMEVDLSVHGLVEAREAFEGMKYDECLEWGKQYWKDIWGRQVKIDKEKMDANYRAKFEREKAKAAGAVEAGSGTADNEAGAAEEKAGA